MQRNRTFFDPGSEVIVAIEQNAHNCSIYPGHVLTIYNTSTKFVRRVPVPFSEFQTSWQVTDNTDILTEYEESTLLQNSTKGLIENLNRIRENARKMDYGTIVELSFNYKDNPKGICIIAPGSGPYLGYEVFLKDRYQLDYGPVPLDKLRPYISPCQAEEMIRTVCQQHSQQYTSNQEIAIPFWEFVYAKMVHFVADEIDRINVLILCDYLEEGNCGAFYQKLSRYLRNEFIYPD